MPVKKVTDEDKVVMRRLYRAGTHSTIMIARIFGIKHQRVNQILRETGIIMRRRGRYKKT
jgi:hypothetical protein